jgi:hypothetical protein
MGEPRDMSNERAFKSVEGYRASVVSNYGTSSYNGIRNGFNQPIFIHYETKILYDWGHGKDSRVEEKEYDWSSYRLAPFPSCCGATILHAFHKAYTTDYRLLKNQGFIKGHLYLAILAGSQDKSYGKDLVAAGFRKVSDNVVNSNSNRKLHLYIRDPKRERKKTVSAFGGK